MLVSVHARTHGTSITGRNRYGCEYQYICDLLQVPDFSFEEYRMKENLSITDLINTMRPLFYASSVSCMSTGLMIAGGSNLAKFLYYKNVLSRREEVTAKRNGSDSSNAIRRNALEKKVRQTRNKDIREVSGEMVHNGVVKLEEDALVMEFATGVPMEEHYDLVAHDDIMAEVQKAADRERIQGDAAKGVTDLSQALSGEDGLDMELDLAKVQAAGGAVAAGSAGAAALKEANQLKQLQVDLQKITAKLETARATMEGRVPNVQAQLNVLKDQVGDAHAQLQAKADGVKARAEEARLAAEKMRADMEEMEAEQREKMQEELDKVEAQAEAMEAQASSAMQDSQVEIGEAAEDAQAQATGAPVSVPALPTAEEMAGMTKQQKREAQKAAKEAQKKVSSAFERQLYAHYAR